MPRFFFDMHDGVSNIDDTGTVLSGLAEARTEAARMSGAMLSQHAAEFWEGGEWTITVRDADGLALFSLIFMAVEGAAASRHRAT